MAREKGKAHYNVDTTPQVFIEGVRIGDERKVQRRQKPTVTLAWSADLDMIDGI
jgi:hypothetical protein